MLMNRKDEDLHKKTEMVKPSLPLVILKFISSLFPRFDYPASHPGYLNIQPY